MTTEEFKDRTIFIEIQLQKEYNAMASLHSRIHVRQQKIKTLKRRLALIGRLASCADG